MLATLSFLLRYSGLALALCQQDLRYGLLPDRFTCPLLWSGSLFYLCLVPHQLSEAIWGTLAGYLPFAILYWLYRRVRGHEGLGYGDIKYLAVPGAWHGWRIPSQLVLIASLLADMTWVILGLSARCDGNRRWEKNSPLPFEPFLAATGFWCGWQTLVNLTL